MRDCIEVDLRAWPPPVANPPPFLSFSISFSFFSFLKYPVKWMENPVQDYESNLRAWSMRSRSGPSDHTLKTPSSYQLLWNFITLTGTRNIPEHTESHSFLQQCHSPSPSLNINVKWGIMRICECCCTIYQDDICLFDITFSEKSWKDLFPISDDPQGIYDPTMNV